MSGQLAQLEIRPQGPLLVAVVTGEVDMSNASDLGSAAAAAVTTGSATIVLELTKVSYIDSAGIHMLYDLRERLAGRGLALAVVVPPDAPTVTALRLTGVLEAIPTFPTLQAAEEGLAA